MNTLTDTQIPVYSLQSSGIKGNMHFEIAECIALTNFQKELFFVPHRNDFYKFIFMRQGKSRHWVDMVQYDVAPNRFYFSSPRQVMLKENGGTNDVISICFTQEFLELEENRVLRELPIIKNPYNGHELVLSAEDVAFLNDISYKILDEFNDENTWKNSMLLAYLQVLLIHLSRLYTEQFADRGTSPERELLTRFYELITENFAYMHDVASYAARVNLSPGHFSEIIKAQSGKTAIQHIHDRLLLEAKRLLFHSDSSVKEIAFALGFEDASYFNRFFKRLTAQTPAAYRASIRKMYH